LKEKLNIITKNNHIRPKIPQIIHQIYEDLTGPPSSLLQISESWKELNPDWEYHFWNKNDINTFLEMYYPDLIPISHTFPYDVQRWDAIRYLILYKMGGLYVDMDYECTESISPLLCETECAMGMEPKGNAILRRMPYIVGNAFMATIPNHPYFNELIKAVFYDNKEVSASSPERSILDTTGPYMTTRVYANSKYRKRVSLIPAELVAPLTRNEVLRMIDGKLSESLENKIDNSFAIHYFLCSWYEQTRKSGCSNS
jgi:mannosyltransferase OCH1-like enzyme